LWAGAVSRALAADHPAYDTLFVELAVRESTPLATFDQKVLQRFPDVARRPAALLG
jgi:predicted nucleic acid-binding protein